jgi:LDH2 family malate/lactate/ureidoglycolate dehydrogenase
MDDLISQIKSTSLADGAQKIWIHGEKEFLRQKAQARRVEIEEVVIHRLRQIADELNVPFNLA